MGTAKSGGVLPQILPNGKSPPRITPTAPTCKAGPRTSTNHLKVETNGTLRCPATTCKWCKLYRPQCRRRRDAGTCQYRMGSICANAVPCSTCEPKSIGLPPNNQVKRLFADKRAIFQAGRYICVNETQVSPPFFSPYEEFTLDCRGMPHYDPRQAAVYCNDKASCQPTLYAR
jgi:hypothetical protein